MVVGGWSNTASAIRKDRNVDPKVKVSTDKIISESEFRGFWIEYSRGLVAVGREHEVSITVQLDMVVWKHTIF